MAKTVNEAFSEFMSNTINLLSSENDTAKSSREYLKSVIHNFSGKDGFYNLASQFDCYFGSFSRKTKCKPLNDIDIIIGLNGEDVTIEENAWDNIRLVLKNISNPLYQSCDNEYIYYYNSKYYINSSKVRNRFKTQLQQVPKYYKSEIHSNGSAVTLKLFSYNWVFDIVPAFHSDTGYYLIPNGKGNWKKTNPQKEQERVSSVNQKLNGRVLDTIRLIKYWNKRGRMPTVVSYVMETMVVDYFNNISDTPQWIEQRFRDVLEYIKNNIWNSIYDAKGIEGNINNLSWEQKLNIQSRANNDYDKANNAIYAEVTEKNQQKAIRIWKEILGDDFPIYN